MVKRVFRALGLERLGNRVAGQFTTWPADEFDVTPPPVESPLPSSSIAPASVEMRFMKLHAEGRFGEMWDMLAEDAQRAWGSRELFIREMPRLDEWLEILDLSVVSAALLESWTDHVHQRTYSNVARLVMRYRVRQQWKEWTFDRQVHLVPAAGGWGTLCYPTREARAAIGR